MVWLKQTHGDGKGARTQGTGEETIFCFKLNNGIKSIEDGSVTESKDRARKERKEQPLVKERRGSKGGSARKKHSTCFQRKSYACLGGRTSRRHSNPKKRDQKTKRGQRKCP